MKNATNKAFGASAAIFLKRKIRFLFGAKANFNYFRREFKN